MLTINGIEERAKQVFSAYPVNEVSLFGSYARGSQTEDSDIDFLIKKSDLSLLTISKIKQDLISVLGEKVDLVSESDISDVFRFLIKDDEVIIYEKSR
jgi:predicted nucleotidyltransferase